MNIQQLETFISVSKCGSFSQAAKNLRSTTSTVSIRIKELETTIGAPLFERSKHGVRLTSVGRELCTFAAKAVAAFDDVRAIVGRKSAFSGIIRLGAGEMIAVTWLSDLIRMIRVEFPKLTVELSVALTSPLLERLNRDDLDLALIPSTGFENSLTAYPLGQVEFVWMDGGDSKISEKVVDQQTLRNCRILSYGKGSFHHATILKWLGTERSDTIIDFYTNVDVIASIVKSGMGVGLLPICRYARELETGELRVLRMWQPITPVQFYAVHQSAVQSTMPRLIAELAQRASNFRL
jgi:DNA-binding transcriptional LysR family regulator